MNNISRSLILSAVAAASLVLAGCGSSVKLDENAGAAPITSATPEGGANGAGVPDSNVAQVNVAPTEDDDVLAGRLSRVIYFDFDSFIIKDDYRNVVEGHARRLTSNKARKVIVEGHTDERGGREYNLALGQKRAEAVVRSLSLLGVAPEQVEAVSFGEERPAAQGSDEGAWAENRRAEIKDR